MSEASAAVLGRVSVDGVVLNYTERGFGRADVFIHGGLADDREWLPTIEPGNIIRNPNQRASGG